MFFRILRKDMKRKRTSNVIIMIFVIIATMFVSSSVHNIISVLNGIDGFFDKAGLDCDYIAIARINGEDDLSETLKNSEISKRRICLSARIQISPEIMKNHVRSAITAS